VASVHVMRHQTGLILLLASIALGGCASGPQYRALPEAGPRVELADVPFFPQEDYQCGPAALATVLADAGIQITAEELIDQVYVPGRQGSLQMELLAATRRQGQVPYLLPGAITPLIEELHAGRPVLVFQNLRLERWPAWHYAVLIGYEPERRRFLLRSGTEHRKKERARQFLGTWDRAGRWAMVVASPSDPPASATPLEWLKAVAPFESTGQLEVASAGYEAAVARWPESASAWTALGNARFHAGRLHEAAVAYEAALDRSAGHWVARNNLVQTMLALGCPGRAREQVAAAGTPPPEMAEPWRDTLDRLAATEAETCEFDRAEPIARHSRGFP
jgi:tetratricopeptide (TPR) repeat protein